MWYRLAGVIITSLIAAIIVLTLPIIVIIVLDIKEGTLIYPEYIVEDNVQPEIAEIYL